MPKPLKILLTLFFSIIILFGFTETVKLFNGSATGGWYQQFLPNLNGKQIVDITFLDSLTGWAVTNRLSSADSSLVLKTTNGGNNWFINHTDTSFIYKRVQFINQNTGFICGSISINFSSYILKTTNGGNNWFYISAPAFTYQADISVLNEDSIWFAMDESSSGGIFRTTNGGVNWTRTDLFSSGGNPDKIYMYNRNIGFAATSGALYKTTNSGINWNRVTGTDGFTDIHFVDSLTGWKVKSFIKKTTDGGTTWIQQVLPSGGIILSPFAGKISVLNSDTIWAVGGTVCYNGCTQTRGLLFRTTNGGDNWLFQVPDTSIHINTYYSYVQFLNVKVAWAYTLGLGGIHTTNGGDTTFLAGIHQISNNIPKDYKLYQNYPNPFNPVTVISYQLKVNSHVLLSIYNITGKHVMDLVKQKQNAGTYQVIFQEMI